MSDGKHSMQTARQVLVFAGPTLTALAAQQWRLHTATWLRSLVHGGPDARLDVLGLRA